MTSEDWRAKVILQDGESLKFERSYSRGFMEEEDVEEYQIVLADGTVTGSVVMKDHIAVKGFKQTVWVVQKNAAGETILDVRL